ncbi:MAG: hypothetical protein AAGF12_17000, partial [Myxococcota bacterium]
MANVVDEDRRDLQAFIRGELDELEVQRLEARLDGSAALRRALAELVASDVDTGEPSLEALHFELVEFASNEGLKISPVF